uniref:Spermatogenesis associated 32 n=2 Tax=Sus scrofa TaxID=9823 RepID=A0A8D1PX83_PIG
MANLEPYNEDPKPQGPRLESLHPHPEGLRQKDISQWSTKSNSSYLGFAEEEKVLSPDHRSIRVQTSRHLFWSDKLIQASEHSLQEKTQKSPTRTSRHPKKPSISKDTLCSKKLLQDPSDQPAPPDSGSPQPPSPDPPSSPQTIGLAELINLASSLAVASSSKTDLPSLKHLIKASPQKATEPSAEATTDEPKKEKPSQDLPPEKPLETRELPKAPKEEDRRLPHPYLDFSKPGFKRATIEGEVKFLQSPNMSPQPQGAEKEPPQKPQQLFSRDPGEGQASRTQKRRPQKRAALRTQMEPAAAAARGAEQASQRAREFKGLGAHTVQSGPRALSQR